MPPASRVNPPPPPCSLTCSIITNAGVVFQAELQRNIFSTGIDLWQGNLTHGREEEATEELTETKCWCGSTCLSQAKVRKAAAVFVAVPFNEVHTCCDWTLQKANLNIHF